MKHRFYLIIEVPLTDNIPFFFLKKLLDTNIFDQSEAINLFEALIDGKLDETQTAVFLTALAFCPENPVFLANAASQVLKRGQKLPSFPHKDAIDTCGTGGDYSSSFNISTTVAFILAACEVPVIKHGNRSSSSNSGSSDVLQFLGIRIDLSPESAEATFKKLGICFCFAPQYYPFLKNLAPIRKKLGFRTIFNQIGPLVNPGGAGCHLLGVSRNSFLDLFANAILAMDKKGIVVCGGGRMDEVVLDAPNELRIIHSGAIYASTLFSSDFGLNPVSMNEIRVNSIEDSAGLIVEILNGRKTPGRDVVLANTAVALLAANKVKNVKDGVELAKFAIDQGKAKEIFEQLKTQGV
ncbi:MAG: anthranilate phosphoribosyltransferase [Planctomycetes bacterium]|nr:anthranilate phosphoribosyltransferase [Planctomycetota bacterium]